MMKNQLISIIEKWITFYCNGFWFFMRTYSIIYLLPLVVNNCYIDDWWIKKTFINHSESL